MRHCTFPLTVALRHPQANVEVEIREAPRPFPVLSGPQALGRWLGEANGRAGNDTGNSTLATDSASLAPDVLFRVYLEREREGGRTISEEVTPVWRKKKYTCCTSVSDKVCFENCLDFGPQCFFLFWEGGRRAASFGLLAFDYAA